MINNFSKVIAELKHDLSIKTHKIQNLVNKTEKLQMDNFEKDILIEKLTKQLIEKKTKKIQMLILPVEILDEIFVRCDAQTKLNFSATCKGFNQRYKTWKDVKSVYITRKPMEFLPNKTIIPQSFVVKTNVFRLSHFCTTSLVAMAPKFSKVRQLFIESSEQLMTNVINQIPVQSGFFEHFQEVRFIKICNVSDNLSLNYTLDELFSLPKLEVLHVRELKNNMTFLYPSNVKAPLKELRLAIRLTKVDGLGEFFDKLSSTLESLELVPLRTHITIGSNLGGDLLPIIVAHLPNLRDLYLAHTITKHSSFDQNLHLLKNLTQLKSVTFELMYLQSLSSILENLPPTCETVVVTEAFYIQEDVVGLTTGTRFRPEKVFSPQKIALLRNELRGIHRKITIQLGRLRENSPITVNHNVTPFVTFVSNATGALTIDNRVFLFNKVIYKRKTFLKKLGIMTDDNFP